ncbi:hypothetical protein Q4Q40_04920 [Flavivirga jejuensis]|uniref:Uncharacterized protein n=1 Tax=Flavivirga jejuensis TaxID=870487 RepID=A0ABT8WK33_9FLAO|nr:hypothetical protein [Flavivirga jejuensis]
MGIKNQNYIDKIKTYMENRDSYTDEEKLIILNELEKEVLSPWLKK